MRNSMLKRYLPNYEAERTNKIHVNLSEEDYDLFYAVFIENGAGTCLSTLLVLTLLQKLRDAGIKNYTDRIQSPAFASFDAIVTDVIGYKAATPIDEGED
jgi:hypothetical protein